MHTPCLKSADGLELQFATNHVGHQYLTSLLLPALEAAQPSAAVVSVSSSAAFFSYWAGINLAKERINDCAYYNPVLAYGQSKLANILFAQELAVRVAGKG